MIDESLASEQGLITLPQEFPENKYKSPHTQKQKEKNSLIYTDIKGSNNSKHTQDILHTTEINLNKLSELSSPDPKAEKKNSSQRKKNKIYNPEITNPIFELNQIRSNDSFDSDNRIENFIDYNHGTIAVGTHAFYKILKDPEDEEKYTLKEIFSVTESTNYIISFSINEDDIMIMTKNYKLYKLDLKTEKFITFNHQAFLTSFFAAFYQMNDINYIFLCQIDQNAIRVYKWTKENVIEEQKEFFCGEGHLASDFDNILYVKKGGGFLISLSNDMVMMVTSIEDLIKNKSQISRVLEVQDKIEELEESEEDTLVHELLEKNKIFVSPDENYFIISHSRYVHIFKSLLPKESTYKRHDDFMKLVWSFECQKMNSAAFSSDNKVLAIGGLDFVNLYNFEANQLLTCVKKKHGICKLVFKEEYLLFSADSKGYKFGLRSKPTFDQLIKNHFSDRIIGIDFFHSSETKDHWIIAYESKAAIIFLKEGNLFIKKHYITTEKNNIVEIRFLNTKEPRFCMICDDSSIQDYLIDKSKSDLILYPIEKKEPFVHLDSENSLFCKIYKLMNIKAIVYQRGHNIFLRVLIDNKPIDDKDPCIFISPNLKLMTIAISHDSNKKAIIFIGAKNLVGIYRIDLKTLKWSKPPREKNIKDEDEGDEEFENKKDGNLSHKQFLKRTNESADIKALVCTSKYLIVADSTNRLEIFSIKSRNLIKSFPKYQQKWIIQLTTYDDRYLVSCSADKSIKIIDLHFMETIWHVQNHHSRTIRCARIMDIDGHKHIISGSNDLTCRIYSLEFNEEQPMRMSSALIPRYFHHESFLLEILGSLKSKEKVQKLFENKAAEDFRVWPTGFTLLHLLAERAPTVLGETNLDYSTYKSPFPLDSKNKTPLHYLFEDLHFITRKLTPINKLANYIVCWATDEAHSPELRMRVLNSLTDLMTEPTKNLLGKLDVGVACNLLRGLIQVPETKNSLDPTFFGLITPQNEIIESKRPYLKKSDSTKFIPKAAMKLEETLGISKLKTLLFDKEQGLIRINVTLIKLDYSHNSEDMRKIVEVLQGITNQSYFEQKFVKVIIDRLWKYHRYYHFGLCAIFSTKMVLYSLSVGNGAFTQNDIGTDYNGLNTGILILNFVLLANEVFIQLIINPKEYFRDFWNFVEFSYYWLLFTTLIYNFNPPDDSNVALSWLATISLFLGYLRWLSYFRLFDISRGFVTVVLSIIKHMWSFGILLLFTFIGFGLIFTTLNTDPDVKFGDNLLTSFLSLYGPQDMSSATSSQKIVISIAALILSTVLSNLLVTIMSKSHDALFEEEVINDAQERLSLIKESMNFYEKSAKFLNFWRKCCEKTFRRRKSKKTSLHNSQDRNNPEKPLKTYLFIAENES